MNFMKPIAIFIPRILTATMTNRSMLIAPFWESCIHVIFVCINQCPYRNDRLHQRSDGLLLNILQHLDADFSSALHHSHNWRLFGGQCATPPGASQSMPSSLPLLFPDHCRIPLMPGNHINFITCYCSTALELWLFFTMPSRSWVVIC